MRGVCVTKRSKSEGWALARFLPTNLAGGILGRHALVNMNFLFLTLTLKPKAAQGLSWFLVSDSVVTKHVFLMDQLAWRAATCLLKLNAFITNYAIALASLEPWFWEGTVLLRLSSFMGNESNVCCGSCASPESCGWYASCTCYTSRAVVMSLTRVMGRTMHKIFLSRHTLN